MEKKNETLLIIAVTLVAGILIGVLGAHLFSAPGRPVTRAPQGAPPADVNLLQKIQMLEGVVKGDPANRNAWVQLGHAYYDTDQPVKSVQAYDKALALDPNDPDVLTDQGVMLLEKLQQFEAALENFKKAQKLNPQHAQSLFNQGIAYQFFLKDLPKAQKVWEEYLVKFPNLPNAQNARSNLEFIKSHPPIPGGN